MSDPRQCFSSISISNMKMNLRRLLIQQINGIFVLFSSLKTRNDVNPPRGVKILKSTVFRCPRRTNESNLMDTISRGSATRFSQSKDFNSSSSFRIVFIAGARLSSGPSIALFTNPTNLYHEREDCDCITNEKKVPKVSGCGTLRTAFILICVVNYLWVSL